MREIIECIRDAGFAKTFRALRVERLLNMAHLNPFVLERIGLYERARKLLRKNGLDERYIDAIIQEAKDEAGHPEPKPPISVFVIVADSFRIVDPTKEAA